MGAVENVFVAAAAGDRSDLASVEADGHLVRDLGLRRAGRLHYRAAEVKSCGDTKRRGGSTTSTLNANEHPITTAD